MQKAGVIESKRLQSNEGPSKKVYQITLSGKLALDAWVAALEEQQREVQLLLGKYRSLTDRDNAVSTNIETI
jgi:DNA-binding PadR family transcriptional regulator